MTDIGLAIGRIIKGDHKELWKLKVLAPIVLGFLLGSFASISTYSRFKKLSLMINVLIFFTIGMLYSLMIKMKLSVPVWRVMFGMYRTFDKTSELGKKQLTKAAKKVKKISNKLKEKVETNIKKIKKSTETFNPLISHTSGSEWQDDDSKAMD